MNFQNLSLVPYVRFNCVTDHGIAVPSKNGCVCVCVYSEVVMIENIRMRNKLLAEVYI